MAEISHLENRHDVIFFLLRVVWFGLNFADLLQNDIDCGDMVKLETRCRIPIWRTLDEFHGRSSQSHLPHCRCCHLANSISWSQSYVSHCMVLPAANSTACQSRATNRIAGCMIPEPCIAHCRVQSPGEINVMIVPRCRV